MVGGFDSGFFTGTFGTGGLAAGTPARGPTVAGVDSGFFGGTFGTGTDGFDGGPVVAGFATAGFATGLVAGMPLGGGAVGFPTAADDLGAPARLVGAA